jgi:hypothetical protein
VGLARSRQQGPRGRSLVSAARDTCECRGGGAAGAGTATGIAGAASAGMAMGADEVGVMGAGAASRVAGTAVTVDVAVEAVESVFFKAPRTRSWSRLALVTPRESRTRLTDTSP